MAVVAGAGGVAVGAAAAGNRHRTPNRSPAPWLARVRAGRDAHCCARRQDAHHRDQAGWAARRL